MLTSILKLNHIIFMALVDNRHRDRVKVHETIHPLRRLLSLKRTPVRSGMGQTADI